MRIRTEPAPESKKDAPRKRHPHPAHGVLSLDQHFSRPKSQGSHRAAGEAQKSSSEACLLTLPHDWHKTTNQIHLYVMAEIF